MVAARDSGVLVMQRVYRCEPAGNCPVVQGVPPLLDLSDARHPLERRNRILVTGLPECYNDHHCRAAPPVPPSDASTEESQ